MNRLLTHMLERWHRLARRDRRALQGLVVVSAATALGLFVAIPAGQRLVSATLALTEQRAVAARLAHAPRVVRMKAPAPSARQLHEQATAAGLAVDRFVIEGGLLRLQLTGPPQAVAQWLHPLFSTDLVLLELSLERVDSLLRVTLQSAVSAGV